jgi:hypothetical protein
LDLIVRGGGIDEFEKRYQCMVVADPRSAVGSLLWDFKKTGDIACRIGYIV